jgi:hypothetical protein
MIRSGKTSETPWLKLSSDEYHAWAEFNEIEFNECQVTFDESSRDLTTKEIGKGGGLVCQTHLDAAVPPSSSPFIKVSPEMVLSEARVVEMARGDSKLAELLRSCGSLLTVSK